MHLSFKSKYFLIEYFIRKFKFYSPTNFTNFNHRNVFNCHLAIEAFAFSSNRFLLRRYDIHLGILYKEYYFRDLKKKSEKGNVHSKNNQKIVSHENRIVKNSILILKYSHLISCRRISTKTRTRLFKISVIPLVFIVCQYQIKIIFCRIKKYIGNQFKFNAIYNFLLNKISYTTKYNK